MLVGCTIGLRIISVRTGSVTPLSTGSARDLAVTSDSRTAYLAEETSELWKLDLNSRQLSEYLYMNYQRFGPPRRSRCHREV